MKQTLILLFIFLCSWCFGQKSVVKDSVQRSSDFREYVEIRKKWKTFLPANGCVPDEKTAIKIAEAIWHSIYGDKIYEEKPFKVKLEDGIWIVKGTFMAMVSVVLHI